MGRIVRESIGEIRDRRPFFDSEHGPIHSFKDKHRRIPDAFDDEYFRHMQWAHLAAGGAGGGMRWPNRKPHVLTMGMRRAQRALAGFVPLIDWARFDRHSLGPSLIWRDPAGSVVGEERLARFGCASNDQAVVYALRRDRLGPTGLMDRDGPPLHLSVEVPGLAPGTYRVTTWDTAAGHTAAEPSLQPAGAFRLPPVAADVAVALRRE